LGISVTNEAKDKLLEIMKESELKIPAIRVVFAGFG